MTQPLLTGDSTVAEPFAALPAWQCAFLREVDAFNIEIYNRFAHGRFFVATIIDYKIDVDALLAEHGEKIQRGAQLDVRKRGQRWRTDHRQFLLELEPELFVFVNSNLSCVRCFSRDPKLAETTVRNLAEKFRARRRKPIESPRFHLISFGNGNLIDTAAVKLDKRVRRTDEQLKLLYGSDFAAWEKSLIETLQTKTTGTVILRGPPGTGKTSIIRHWISRLHRSHRIYLLPISAFELLTAPTLVEFWVQEARAYPNRQKLIILEDAEALLADRSAGNRGAIANLLNIADGLLGDWLQMQLVLSANCSLAQLDPAIVRSGRLLAAWEFKPLSPEQAQRVATAYGLTLEPQPEGYTLSAIFCGASKTLSAPPRRELGFGAHLGVTSATSK